jgi:hypothetical protein
VPAVYVTAPANVPSPLPRRTARLELPAFTVARSVAPSWLKSPVAMVAVL